MLTALYATAERAIRQTKAPGPIPTGLCRALRQRLPPQPSNVRGEHLPPTRRLFKCHHNSRWRSTAAAAAVCSDRNNSYPGKAEDVNATRLPSAHGHITTRQEVHTRSGVASDPLLLYHMCRSHIHGDLLDRSPVPTDTNLLLAPAGRERGKTAYIHTYVRESEQTTRCSQVFNIRVLPHQRSQSNGHHCGRARAEGEECTHDGKKLMRPGAVREDFPKFRERRESAAAPTTHASATFFCLPLRTPARSAPRFDAQLLERTLLLCATLAETEKP